MSSDESKRAIPRIRTFAGDLNAERAKRGEATPPQTPEALKKQPKPAPKAKKPAPVPQQMPKIVAPDKKETPKTPVPQKPPVAQAPIKIPAFHELKKHQDTPVNKPAKPIKKPKIKTNGNKKPQRNIGYDSMVITDTKSKQFKLVPSIITSIKSWFKKITTRKKKAAPKYTVPETDRRKGVIQKATSKTGAIFTADNKTLKEQIRRRQKTAAAEGDAEEAETTWSPFTETGFNLLEPGEEAGDTTTNVTVEFKKQTRLPSDKKPIQVMVPSKQAEIPTEAEPVEEVPTEETVGPNEEPFEDTSILTVADDTPDVTNIPTLIPDEEEPESEVTEPGFLNRFDTNTLTIILVVSVVGLLAVIFITRVVVDEIRERTATEVSVTAQAESVLQDTQLVTISFTAANLDQLPQLIKTAADSAPDGLVELPIVTLDDNDLNPSYLFEVLGFRTLPSLEQSITVARFVTIDQSDPALILQFVDKDTVRGGLLSWEETMATDMKTLYNMPDEIPEEFIDETIGEIDVRALRYEDEISLVYGFIGENTLLIASSEADFTQIQQAQ